MGGHYPLKIPRNTRSTKYNIYIFAIYIFAFIFAIYIIYLYIARSEKRQVYTSVMICHRKYSYDRTIDNTVLLQCIIYDMTHLLPLASN